MVLRVSVIIPTYQHAAYVADAVKSALAQTYPAYQVIVVDDGSTDQTSEVLAQFGESIQIIRQPNRGLPAARNSGICAASGDLLAFLDADDLWFPDKLARQVPLFERDSQVGLVFSNAHYFDAQGLHKATFFDLVPPASGEVFTTLFERNFVPVLTAVVRRDCLRTAGEFDESLTACEDYDLWLRIARDWKLDYIQETLARYRLSSGQMSGNPLRMLQNMLIVRRRCLEKNPELAQLPPAVLDKCYYQLMIFLAKHYLQAGISEKAHEQMVAFHNQRGWTVQYAMMSILLALPQRFSRWILKKYDRRLSSRARAYQKITRGV